MQKKQSPEKNNASWKPVLRYILCDFIAALLSWGALFTFRKLVLEPSQAFTQSSIHTITNDPNFWLGLAIVPLGWLALYTIQGTYRNVLRKARLKELLDTALASLIGSVVLFFLLLIDDNVGPSRNHYLSFLFLLAVHFSLTYMLRLLLTSQTVHRVHTRQIGFPTLLIGSGNKAYHTYLDIENQETYSGNLFVGYINVNEELRTLDSSLDKIMPCLGSLDDLRTLVEKHNIEEVIIAVEDEEKERINDIRVELRTTALDNFFNSDFVRIRFLVGPF